ncbi:acyltransferase family protein [Falsirhodobacter sp. 1013]|uniref:acyltransferase family protein n=1 Tax=Falsirhodobacter sp. 1013 TaxID=3417566 RepID=UPI003EC00F45
MVSRRESWLDELRGVSICLVIFHHCYLATAALVEGTGHGFILPIYTLDTFVGLVRMPAFFLCSGILFASASVRGWNWFLRKRLAWTLWVAALWGWAAAGTLLSGIDLYPWWEEPGRISTLQLLLIAPIGNMWFVYTIAILAALAMALRGIGKVASLLLAVLLSVVALFVNRHVDLPAGIGQVVWNLGLRGFLFFTIGFVFADQLIRPRTGRLIGLLLAVVIWAGCYYILKQMEGSTDLCRLALSVPAAFAAVYALQYLLPKVPRIGRFFAFMGMRSLELFLLHQFLIAAVFPVVQPSILHDYGDVALAIMFAVTLALSTVAALALRMLPENAVFALPSRRLSMAVSAMRLKLQSLRS